MTCPAPSSGCEASFGDRSGSVVRAWCACCRRSRVGRAADVHVRDAGAVRGLAAQQAAAGRAGRLPAGAGAQGNAGCAAPRPAAPPRAPPHTLPRLDAAPPPQLPRRAALPQLLLTHPHFSLMSIHLSFGEAAERGGPFPPDLCRNLSFPSSTTSPRRTVEATPTKFRAPSTGTSLPLFPLRFLSATTRVCHV